MESKVRNGLSIQAISLFRVGIRLNDGEDTLLQPWNNVSREVNVKYAYEAISKTNSKDDIKLWNKGL